MQRLCLQCLHRYAPSCDRATAEKAATLSCKLVGSIVVVIVCAAQMEKLISKALVSERAHQNCYLAISKLQ